MVFKKPYAFFIKYFRVINLILCFLFGYLIYKLNLIKDVLGDIYLGSVTNYSNLNVLYIGFKMYLLLFLMILLLVLIIILLKYKKKPLKDYLFSFLYVILIYIYLSFVSKIFFTLEENIIEQTSLKLYSDISFLVIIPLLYFIIRFILIVIGFDLSKFNFTKDIIELKKEEKDNEEIEVIFDKNTYKYKRKFRKTFREFKYYVLENKFIIGIIIGSIVFLLFITTFSINIFKSNKVRVNENFFASGINYKINNVYETMYDLNYKNISMDSKFVIVHLNVVNNNTIASTIDFKRIRLLYKNDYVYANNYFNNFFVDMGIPYNNEPLTVGKLNNYILVFEVPNTYKSNKYTLKFYDRVVFENEELKGSYKEIDVTAKKIDKNHVEKNYVLNDSILIDEKTFGDTKLSISNFDMKSSYVYNDGKKNHIIKDNDINKSLLILDYNLSIDDDSLLSEYFSKDVDFFNKFLTLEYTYNGNNKKFYGVKALATLNNKVVLSVPLEVKNSTEIKVIFNFRNVKINYKLK